jgi:hypothetical protein
MKKIFLIIAAFTIIINTGKAQDEVVVTVPKNDVRDRLMLGFKAGGNLANIYDTEGGTATTYPVVGFAGGTFLSIPIGKYLGVQPEVLFSQRGFQAQGNTQGNSYNITRITSYVDVPVLFAFKPSRFLTVLAGPQFSYLVQRNDYFVSGSTSVSQQVEFENDNIRKNTYCFTGGVDINIRHFVFGARAGWDIRHNNGDGSVSTIRYKNVWYQATVGFRLYNSRN